MSADLVLFNGIIHTMDAPGTVSALAASGDRVLAAGDDQTIRALAGSKTQVVDLAGRCAVPGMIDAHLHLAWYGLSLSMVNLEGAHSVQECLTRVGERAHAPSWRGNGAWIRGSGWNENDWTSPRQPQRFDLDKVAPANPVTLLRKDGHSIWVNSLALKLAGIGAATEAPAGGTIDRDPLTHEPTGILRENAMAMVESIVPPAGPAAIEEGILAAQERALAAGLTGVGTMEGPDVFAALQRLDSAGKLALRVSQTIAKDHLDEAIGLGLRTGFGNRHVRVGGVKLFADGSLGSATAAMLDSYGGQPGNHGVVTLSKDEMLRLVKKATAAGIWPVVHAIGDRANRDVLDVFEAAGAGTPAVEAGGLRFRIEHVQVLHPDDIARFARLGIIASMQPTHCTSDRDMADRLWGERSRYAYAWRSLLASGAALAFGSDCPVETISPLEGIYAAVTRRRLDDNRPAWYPQECLTASEALRAFTMGSAYATGEENIKGSLAPGKLADLAVLSHDILSLSPDELASTSVDMTIAGGRIAYRKD